MTDKELENISEQLIKQTVAECIGKVAITPDCMEEELSKMNRYKAHLLVHLKIIEDGIKIINSYSEKGVNNDRN